MTLSCFRHTKNKAGPSIGQSRSYLNGGFLGNYDQIYGKSDDANDAYKMPGDYYIVDAKAAIKLIDSKELSPLRIR